MLIPLLQILTINNPELNKSLKQVIENRSLLLFLIVVQITSPGAVFHGPEVKDNEFNQSNKHLCIYIYIFVFRSISQISYHTPLAY